MAEKRMFTKKITDSDAFIEMSSAAQALYFHLNQSADDDGFNNQIQMAMFRSHASVDDLKVLMLKNFIIRFESGVIVIKHWRMHNTLRKDRYNPTNFQEELALLNIKDNGSYSLSCDDGCQVVAERLPQVSIGKVSIVEDRIDKDTGKKEKKLASAQTYFPNDEKLNSTFLDFMNMRKSLKNGKMTERAVTMMINKLNKYDVNTAVAMLENSILNNWKDVYDPKQQAKQSTTSKNKFNQFPQREYSQTDYSSLEQRLLNKG